ncbi:MAG: HD domain-containing protein [Candidatus Marinimicrobia bacterium]|nr:HD domain-containing protein [Candidatus Neomarinimicrobiota bacterium]
MKIDLKQLLDEQPDIYALIQRLSDVAQARNLRAYLVGGFVRDLFIARKNKDIDIVVVGDGLAFADAVSSALNAYPVVKFEEFGTAMIPLKQVDLEIVSARSEVYQKHSRNPKVRFTGLDEDLKRRDFTINSMAICINRDAFGEFIDPFRGMQDLKAQKIITPLDPQETFFEDPLRMLRAVRFAAQLSFVIEEKTFDAIVRDAQRIDIISKERVRDEFLKILMSPSPAWGIDLLYRSGLMACLFPEIIALQGVDSQEGLRHKDVYDHTLKVLENVALYEGDLILRLAALFHDIGKPRTKRFVEGSGWTFHGHEEVGARMFEKMGKILRLPARDIKLVARLIRLHLRPIAVADDGVTDSAIRRLMVEAGEDIDALLTLCRADITSKNPQRVKRYLSNFEQVEKRIAEVGEKDALRAFQSPLDGKEIMQMFGLKPGPRVGTIKKHIEEAILEGEIENSYEAAKAYAEKNKEKLIDMYLINH